MEKVSVEPPDPEALLAQAEAEELHRRVGRLKVFFGMCPGVGKTYAMLQEAQEKRRGGAEIVVGFIETPARPRHLTTEAGVGYRFRTE